MYERDRSSGRSSSRSSRGDSSRRTRDSRSTGSSQSRRRGDSGQSSARRQQTSTRGGTSSRSASSTQTLRRGSSASRTGTVSSRNTGTRRGQNAPRGNGSSSRRTPPSRNIQRPTGVPQPLAIIFVLIAAAAAAAITFFIMNPRLQSARKDAREAKTEVAELTHEVDLLNEQIRMAEASASAGVESPWIASGRFTTGDATLDKEVKEFCDSHCNTNQSLDEAALLVYEGVAWSEYVERDDAQNPAGPDWRIEYARKYFEHDCTGNCYEFACANMYCLRYLGFSDAMAEAVIIEKQSGDWGDHGIVFVTNTDGRKCLIDTSMGVNGWMLDTGVYNYEIKNVAELTPTDDSNSTDTDAATTTTTDTTADTGTTTTDDTATTDTTTTTDATTGTDANAGETTTDDSAGGSSDGGSDEETDYVGVADDSGDTESA